MSRDTTRDERRCEFCDEPLPANARRNRRFCDRWCQLDALARKRRQETA